MMIDGAAQRACVLPVSAVGERRVTNRERLAGRVGAAVPGPACSGSLPAIKSSRWT